MDKYRLFLAIEIPAPLQKKLAKKTHDLWLKTITQKPTNQLHITVHFLGLVSEEAISSLIRHIEEVLMKTTPFSIGIQKPGVFPTTSHTKTFWFGITGD